LVLRLLRDEYPEYATTGKRLVLEGAVASAALFGSVIGQVVAGTLADVIGRKKIFIATAILITVGCFGSASSVDTPLLTIYGQIACWRFFLGAGVGGEYPLAATVTSESTSAARRGSLMAAVFAMQGVGSILSVIVVMICLYFNYSGDFTWRFSLAFGAVPVMIAFPWRLRMHETETFEKVQQNRRDLVSYTSYGSALSTVGLGVNSRDNSQTSQSHYSNNGPLIIDPSPRSMDVEDESKKSDQQSTSYSKFTPYNNFKKVSDYDTKASDSNYETLPLLPSQIKSNSLTSHDNELQTHPISFSRYAEIRRAWLFYKWHILGTALSWFLLDVDFYANGLFNHDVTSLIFSNQKKSTSFDDARNSFLLCLISIPGYWLSVVYMERVGRKAIQFNGFIIMAFLFFICTLFHDWFVEENSPPYRKWLFLLLYSLTFLFRYY
jgi:PHS family inorganic phosphate transporter-like MFS transporter